MRKGLDFLEKDNKQIKEEIKSRKKWLTALINEYGKARTQNNEITKRHVIEMIDTARIMIKHYEAILEEHNAMLKELKEMN